MAIAWKVLEKLRLMAFAFGVQLCIIGQINRYLHSPAHQKTATVHLPSQFL
ncbi:hypothetical protein I8751_13955 [Nostocaceae cyanobacterium CENA357]|uniref:Uncharacterized protein n=1 Tax=Atlanticothrix silvestris CENA357 TaxID=1725252 RepID=A0A8J7HID1_9CYAN|nr:hypothetical protein [Atlanticothrix silvestris CENA357]